MTPASRVFLDSEPFLSLDADRDWLNQGCWPAEWITHPASTAPCRLAFRLLLDLTAMLRTRIHVAADERYELYLDGQLIGWGSERGSLDRWFFDSYDLGIPPGPHALVAIVVAHGPHGLRSQMTLGPGFLLAAESDAVPLNTGRAPWESRALGGLHFERPFPHDFFSIGWNTISEGASWDWDAPLGLGPGWGPTPSLHAGSNASRRNRHPAIHLLAPSRLPSATREVFSGGCVRHVSAEFDAQVVPLQHLNPEAEAWSSWWSHGQSILVPPHQQRRLLVDLQDYVCAWPALSVSGGAGSRIQVHWAESLYNEPDCHTKGNRARTDNKFFSGVGDTFLPDGGRNRAFCGTFIRSGRYLEVRILTTTAPLDLHRLELQRAEYPLKVTGSIACDFPAIPNLMARCQRTLLASCHDGFIDGPYYEQMAWVGDMPQDALALYTASGDDRPARKALEVFDASRLSNGLIRARWPARDSLVIPGFALHWIGLLHDFAWWRNAPPFVTSLLPGQRAILDYFLGCLGNDRLLRLPYGWCFADWVPFWKDGTPPAGPDGEIALFHWQLIWTLQRAAVLEQHFGEPELAARNLRTARELTGAAEVFWDERLGLYADNTNGDTFSEHVQSLALLSGQLAPTRHQRVAQGLLGHSDLTRTTVSYTHYLFEALHSLGAIAAIWQRLSLWFDMEPLGFLTTPEGPEPCRSDCHGWSTHPHFHVFASLLGIRPSSPGFRTVRIQPHLGSLQTIQAVLPHPDGEIRVSLSKTSGSLGGEILLPASLTGEFLHAGNRLALHGGTNRIG